MKRKEPIGPALRRICQRHLDKALAGLARTDRSETIHTVRKEIKKLRAVFRLLEGTRHRKKYRAIARLLRLAPKPLAAPRDARVRCRAFELLVQSKPGQFGKTRRQLRTSSQRAEIRFYDFKSAARTRDLLKKARRRLGNLGFKRFDWPDLRRGLEASLAGGREAYQRAGEYSAASHLHEWRKQVKDLGYQLDFLCAHWPAKTRARLAALERLGDELGHEHDLALLEHFVRARGKPGSETTSLQALIATRRKQLATSIRRLGSRLYTGSLAAVCAQVETDWRTWRDA